MSVQYNGGVQYNGIRSVHPGGYHEYSGGISCVYWGDIMINVGEGHWKNN